MFDMPALFFLLPTPRTQFFFLSAGMNKFRIMWCSRNRPLSEIQDRSENESNKVEALHKIIKRKLTYAVLTVHSLYGDKDTIFRFHTCFNVTMFVSTKRHLILHN